MKKEIVSWKRKSKTWRSQICTIKYSSFSSSWMTPKSNVWCWRMLTVILFRSWSTRVFKIQRWKNTRLNASRLNVKCRCWWVRGMIYANDCRTWMSHQSQVTWTTHRVCHVNQSQYLHIVRAIWRSKRTNLTNKMAISVKLTHPETIKTRWTNFTNRKKKIRVLWRWMVGLRRSKYTTVVMKTVHSLR